MDLVDQANDKYIDQIIDSNDLEKWQKRQIERCLVENVINMVIETCGVLQRNTNEILQRHTNDIAQFNEHSQNLEESAILMAISEHGLHQSCGSGSSGGGVGGDGGDIDDNDDGDDDHYQIIPHRFVQCEQQNDLFLPSSNGTAILIDDPHHHHHHHRHTTNNEMILNNSTNNNNNNINNNNDDNFNVLEAAVSVAIQKQGLGLLDPNR